ncbi:MAG: MauE/DoxX family redox-associated membrane protein [Actinomycetota bacterium]
MRPADSVDPSEFGRHIDWKAWVSTACRAGLALVWIWAALAKIADPNASVRAVRAYQLLPEALVKPVGWALPFVELALGMLLLLGLAVRFSALLSGGMFSAFIAGIASAWARGIKISCGCFGGGGPADVDAGYYLFEIGRDVVFLALAVWLIIKPYGHFALEKAPTETNGCDDGQEEEQARR